jgi:AraC-like DNA-binding protein
VLPYSCLTVILDLEGIRRPGREPYQMNRPKVHQPDFALPLLAGIPAVLTPAEPEEFRHLFEALVRHFVNPGAGAALHLKSLSLELLARLAEEARSPARSLPSGTSVRLKRVALFLRRNFHRRLVLDDLAREAGLSPTYLHSLFTGALGVTPREYLTQLRLARARELLAATNWPAADVARACGVDNVPYFFTLFRRRTGLTPGEFRQRHSPLEG